MKLSIRRRDLLSLALATGVLPLLPSRLARADEGTRNLLLVYHPNGLERGWEPTSASLRFSSVLEPLAGLEEKAVVIGGVKGGIRSEPLAHPEGMTSLFTGSRGDGEATRAEGASVDQRVADLVGASTPFASLQLGVQSVGDPIVNTNVCTYDARGRPLPPEDDPRAAFARIFGGVGNPADHARRASVLDHVAGSLGRIRDLYGADEERQLDAHLSAIRSIESRLSRIGDLARCGGGEPELVGDLYDPTRFPELLDLQREIVVRALACGATRVASFQLAHSTTALRVPGVNGDIGFHQVMHERTPDEKRALNAYFVREIASLLHRLEETPGTEGRSLLDDTLVLWGTDMSIGNHGNYPIPFFLFGATGRLRGGRFLDMSGVRPRHTRILETVGALVGLDTRHESPLGTFGGWSDDESHGVLSEVLR